MSHTSPSRETEAGQTPVEAMSEDQLVDSLHEAFQFLEGVPAIGAEVLQRVVDSLSEIVPEVTGVVADLVNDEDGDADAESEDSTTA